MLAQILQQRASQQVSYAPTTAGQQALWVLHGRYPHSSAYNIAFCSRLEGPLRVDALRRALQALVQRHSALRARFVLNGGELKQEIVSYRPLPWREVDASGWDDAEMTERLRQDHSQPFMLEQDIPIRATLYRTHPERHVLLIDAHHIAFDAWSLWLCAEDLMALYQVELGSRAPLPLPSTRFEDYANEQARRWAGPEAERQLAFWREYLAGVQYPVAFPPTHKRGVGSEPCGASARFRIDSELHRAARALATRLGITPFVLYIGTMLVALHRYTGQTDLTIGCPSNGREQQRYQGVVGYFVNPTVVRGDLGGDPSFAELAERLRDRVLQSLAHQEYPFAKLVERLDPPREFSRTPLFQIMLNYHKPQGLAQSLDTAMSGNGWLLDDLRIHHHPIDQQEGQFELVVDLLDYGADLDGVIKYRTDLYDHGFAERLAVHFTNLLRAIVADPQKPLARLEMIDATERRQILEDWNPVATTPAPESCLHHPFLAQAARTPDAVAALHGDEALSYRALLRHASGLAWKLQSLGVGPESCVAICLERSLEMLVAVLGIQLAGGAYVPLDVRSPDERLLGILQQSQAQVLVARPERSATIREGVPHALSIAALDAIPQSDQLPVSRAGPDNLAYVIFTSGSTGMPKGVMVEHRSALNTVLDINQRFSLTAQDRVIGLSSLGFDLSVYDIFGTLASGAALVIPDHAKAADPEHWLALMRRHQVSVWNSAPIMMEMLTGLLRAQQTLLPAELRLVMMSGDWIPLGLPEKIRRHSSSAPQLISLGGATEAAIWSIWFPIGAILPEWKSIPYGRPLDRQRFHVLDGTLNPLPAGAIGELYIGGTGVARGYLGRPDLTAERFISDPFGAQDERLYRTGDLGRYFPDGNIEFLGRIDGQVKIRGYRVELGEIEVCLSRHPDVAEAVVLAKELHHGVKDLVAYIVPRQSDLVLPVADLQAHLRRYLPEYMIPLAFVEIDHFPMTTNGKLDREALPLPQISRPDGERAFVPPRTDLERLLCELWSKVLEVEPLGIHDDFFDLGGQSLLAVMLLAQIGQALSCEMPLEALLTARTVARMAEWLEHEQDDSAILLRLREGTVGQPPLFCIHPVGGNILAYRGLAEHLNPGYAVYGIRALGLHSGELPLQSIPAMVTRYLEAIRQVQPAGPYRLAGWSLGGIIALAIATELEAGGETVELVTLIDSYAQETGGRSVDEAARLAWMAQDIIGMAGVDGELRVEDIGSGPEARDRLIERAVKIGAMPKDTPLEHLRRLCAVLEANLEAMFEHRPLVYQGSTLLLHACDAPEDHPRHPVAAWRHLIVNLTHHFVGGDHYSLMQGPQVQRLAEWIDSHLHTTTHPE